MNKPLSPAEIAQHTRTIYESLHRAPRLVSEVSESIRRDVAEIRADYEYMRDLHERLAHARAKCAELQTGVCKGPRFNDYCFWLSRESYFMRAIAECEGRT